MLFLRKNNLYTYIMPLLSFRWKAALLQTYRLHTSWSYYCTS